MIIDGVIILNITSLVEAEPTISITGRNSDYFGGELTNERLPRRAA